MEKDEEVLEKRKEKIINKIKQNFNSPYDKWVLIVIVLSAIFRYYLFFKSKSQALWFDEGSYLMMAKNWAIGGPSYLEAVRDYLVSVIWVPFIKIGFTEIGLRFLTVSVGIVSFYFFYLVVSHFFGKKIGLISVVLASFFYEHIFWSLRLDVGTYSILFMLISLFCFIKGFETNKKLFFILAAAFAVFSLQAHAPGVFICLLYIVLFPVYTRFKFYKSKYFWIFVFSFILILTPFLIRNMISFDKIYPRFQAGWFERGGEGSSFSEALIYATTTPELIGTIYFIFFIIGLFVSLEVFIILDRIIKEKPSERDLGRILFFSFGLISLALGIHSLTGPGGGIFEPRYIMPYYFAVFIFAAIGIDFVSEKIKKYSKLLSIIFIIFVLLFASYYEIKKTNDLVNLKKESYQDIKQAGLWLGQNTNPADKIITFEAPSISYYSNRQVMTYELVTKEGIKKQILESKPKYLLIWAGLGPDYVSEIMSVISEKNQSFTPLVGFPTNQQPSAVIYKIEDSFFE